MTADLALDPAPTGERTEAWLARHPRRVLFALALLALFVRALVCLQVAGGPLPHLSALWSDSDSHFFDAWGRRVAAGDLLQREPFHPLTPWMAAAGRAALGRAAASAAPAPGPGPVVAAWDRWLGGPTFFQEPAYPYLIGLTYRLAGPDPWWVYAWQLAMGIGGVLAVHELARRMASRTAAAIAGALAVLAPIPMYLELALLRDALVAYTTLGLALAMVWATEGRRRRWLVLGVAFGLAALVKQTFLAFPVLMAGYRLATVRSSGAARVRAGALVLAGMALALLPCVARNLAVGVPPLAMNGSAGPMLPLFHTASASPWQMSIDDLYVRVLRASGGRGLAGLVLAARTHGSLGGLAWLELRKLAYAWHGYEAPNDIDWYVFVQQAPVLGLLPARLAALVPLAALGLARVRQRAWPALVALAVTLAGLVASTVYGRYRAPLCLVLLPLAGAGVLELAGWIRGRRWVAAAGAAAVGAAYLVWAYSTPAAAALPGRASMYRREGIAFGKASPALGALYLAEALRLAPGDATTEGRLGELLLAAGDAEGAVLHLRAGIGEGGAPRQRVLLAYALALSGHPDEAAAVARAVLAAAPGDQAARALLERLEAAPGPAGPADAGGGASP